MGKGRFINQKLGKRTSRRMNLERARVQQRQKEAGARIRIPKQGSSREQRPGR